ncbi:hypothetical protein BJF80_15810 [Serinicoccus sp. CUA-874]|nr:hypothetical protein BJF80_15810 [Serinicoccus sp. CUA-874]
MPAEPTIRAISPGGDEAGGPADHPPDARGRPGRAVLVVLRGRCPASEAVPGHDDLELVRGAAGDHPREVCDVVRGQQVGEVDLAAAAVGHRCVVNGGVRRAVIGVP